MPAGKNVRTSVRNLLFETMRKAFATNDGREIATGALNGLLAGRPQLPVVAPHLPYTNLGGKDRTERDYRGTVLITARFRTGSTLLWNIFRHTDGCVSYYEPLNERRWFDPAARGDRIDRTHRGVDDYWREYDGLTDLGQWHRVDWTHRSLVLDAGAWDPGLRAYMDRLIHAASPKRAVLQFNRVDFRLPWLRRHFPGATLIHLYRHPRDQWCSSLMKPGTVPRDVTIGGFEPHDHFYLQSWATDLNRHFSCVPASGDTPAYRVFYLIWRLSYLFGVAYADHSVSFEDLAAAPEQQIRRMMAAASIETDASRLAPLVNAAPIAKWAEFADDAWFSEHEAACEDVLAEFLRGNAAAIKLAYSP